MREFRGKSCYKAFRLAARILAGFVAMFFVMAATWVSLVLSEAIQGGGLIRLCALAAGWVFVAGFGVCLACVVKEGGEIIADAADGLLRKAGSDAKE